MLFNSYIFCFFFLPLSLLSFVALGRFASRKVVLGWLIIFSLGFYAWWNPPYVFLIIGSIVVNYLLSILILRRRSRAVLALGIVFNLGLLGYYKYAAFLVGNINTLFGTDWALGHIFLPLAISFFTFTQIAFLVDCYRGQDWARGPMEYAGFVTFFPHLLMGPIVLHKELAPQFQSHRFGRVNGEDLTVGLSLFIIGLFKKIVIADSMTPYSNQIFHAAAQGQPLGFYAGWLGAFAFTFQVYFDFSSYSDMALGVARMFGLRLPINFDSPYKAVGFRDFWRRWDMTLTRFFFNYLYIPLGGSRRGEVMTLVNLFIILFLSGLWHGAAWTFVIWGGLHGVFLALNHLWRRHAPAGAQRWGQAGAGRFLGTGITFFGFAILLVLFRASSFRAAERLLTAMAGLHGFDWSALPQHYPMFAGIYARLSQFTSLPWSQTTVVIGFIVCCFAIVWLLPNSQQILGRFQPGLNTFRDGIYRWHTNILSWQPNAIWAVSLGILAWIAIFYISSPRPFVYFKF